MPRSRVDNNQPEWLRECSALCQHKPLIAALPKAELHVHLEGTLEPELMFTIGKRNNVSLPYASPEEARAAYHFKDLQSFLDLYYSGSKVLLVEQDFYEMTSAYLQRARENGVAHVELFFDPQAHTDRGIPFAVFFEGIHRAVLEARASLGLTVELIMCFLRHLTQESAVQALEAAMPYKDKIVAVGLDSSEVGNPPSKFVDVFTEAQKRGFLTVAHAGEEGPPSYIWDAINLLKVKRVDHGVRCVEDPLLVKYLVENNIPLTVCPLSNLLLKVFDDPLTMSQRVADMLGLGLAVTLNSDDPAYFKSAYIQHNYEVVAHYAKLSPEAICLIAKNSFNASFIEDADKQKFCKEIDDVYSQYTSGALSPPPLPPPALNQDTVQHILFDTLMHNGGCDGPPLPLVKPPVGPRNIAQYLSHSSMPLALPDIPRASPLNVALMCSAPMGPAVGPQGPVGPTTPLLGKASGCGKADGHVVVNVDKLQEKVNTGVPCQAGKSGKGLKGGQRSQACPLASKAGVYKAVDGEECTRDFMAGSRHLMRVVMLVPVIIALCHLFMSNV